MPESATSHKVKKLLVWFVVVASVVWTVYNWSGLVAIKKELENVLIIGITLLLSEVFFITGAVLMVIGTGASLRGEKGRIASVLEARKNVHTIAEHISTSPSFRLGFNLNWLGALSTGVVLTLGIILVLPSTSWGLVVLPVLDIIASIGWRLPIDRKLRALKEAA